MDTPECPNINTCNATLEEGLQIMAQGMAEVATVTGNAAPLEPTLMQDTEAPAAYDDEVQQRIGCGLNSIAQLVTSRCATCPWNELGGNGGDASGSLLIPLS